MIRVTGPDSIMYNLISAYTHTRARAGRGRGRGWRPLDEHTMGTGTGARTQVRAVAVAEMGTGTVAEIGSERAKKRKKPHKELKMPCGKRSRLEWKEEKT